MNLNLSIGQICTLTGARFLDHGKLTQKGKINNVIIDSRSPFVNDATLFVLLSGERTNGVNFVDDFFDKGGRVVLTEHEVKNVALSQLAVPNVLEALQRIAEHHRSKFEIPVIAITGSNGKTTVKEWLYHLLKDNISVIRSPKSYNSQIGVALSLFEINSNHQLAIIEAGISKPGEMEKLVKMIKPTHGVYTGIGDAHQSGFESIDQKRLEKFKLFEQCECLFQVVENEILLKEKGSVIGFDYNLNDKGELQLPQISPSAIQLPIGLPGVGSNAALAAITASHFGVMPSEIKAGLETLPPISMRLEKITGNNDNIIINDAYSLDEHSLEMGLRFLETNKGDKKAVVFLGEDPNVVSEIDTLLHKLKAFSSKSLIDALYYVGSKKVADSFEFVTASFQDVNEIRAEKLGLKNCVILFTGSRNTRLERAVSSFTEKKHITRLLINLSSIRHNLQYFRTQLKPEVKVLAMVKSQSYGGGLTPIAEFLEEQKVDYFGVAYADEGVKLRDAGVKTPILVMNPEPAAFDEMIERELEPAIYHLTLLNEFIHRLILHGKMNFPIHVKLETGMNRLGFRSSEIKELTGLVNAQPEVYIKSIFSHFAVADDLNEDDYTRRQISIFEKTSNQIVNDIGYKPMLHLSNSSAALSYESAQYDMVRLGIGMFGLTNHNKNKYLEQALVFVSQISQVRNIKEGETVGYGRAFKAKKDTTIAVIPVGYGDGLNRQLSNGNWKVKIGNDFYPIIGRICMDMCMIDLGDTTQNVGAEVQLFGPGNSVKEMAIALNTIPYEILTSISGRVQRVYLTE